MISDVQHILHGKKYFCVKDLKSCYNQVTMHPNFVKLVGVESLNPILHYIFYNILVVLKFQLQIEKKNIISVIRIIGTSLFILLHCQTCAKLNPQIYINGWAKKLKFGKTTSNQPI